MAWLGLRSGVLGVRCGVLGLGSWVFGPKLSSSPTPKTYHPRPLYQLQLLRLHRANPHALHLAVGGFQNFKAQTVVLHHLAFAGNSPSKFADQAGDSGRFLSFRLAAEKFVKAVHVHSARDDEGALTFAHNLRLVVIVADL